MLFKKYSNIISEILLSKKEFKPLPKIDEREKWDSVSNKYKSELLKEGEKFINYDWPPLLATDYLAFSRNGNRSIYNDQYYERRNALLTLLIAECLENKSRFIDDIINGIWVICNEASWVIPAHNKREQEKTISPLPDITKKPIIDLFSAETAALLTLVYYLLKSKLDQETPLINKRLRYLVKKRLINPYLKRQFHWMGFKKDKIGNWNPWINSNCLFCILVFEEDQEKRIAGVKKAMKSLDVHINSYNRDGGCSEGPHYWAHAGANLFESLDFLYEATNGKINIYEEELIKNIGKYIYRVHIDDDYYINFADGNARNPEPGALIYRFGKKIDDNNMMGFGAHLYQKQQKLHRYGMIFSIRAVNAVLNHQEVYNYPAKLPYIKNYYFEDLQLMIARENKSQKGFYIAAKGGNNDEFHNHNDVGNFIIFYNGKPFIIDPGVERYTAKTFSKDRYSIWTMQSGFHNCPTVNGVMQKNGSEYTAKNVKYSQSNQQVNFEIDIAGAYPEEALINYWKREINFFRLKKDKIEIVDNLSLKNLSNDIYLNIMTACKPFKKDKGILCFKDHQDIVMSYEENKLKIKIEELPINDIKIKKSFGDFLYRIRFKSRYKVKNELFKLAIYSI